MKLTPWDPDVKTIIDRVNAGDIDLQPEFQRQEVWTRGKKKKLIDTILREWSIPPIHLVQTLDRRLEVLDGQQRLSSIVDFYNNRFSINGNITPNDEYVQSLHGVFYKNLDDDGRRNFEQYTIRCFRITDYAPEEPSELFYRLNQPTMLTSGEQRNALFGPAREQLKEVVRHFEGLGNNKESIGFSNNRLAYDDIFARVLFFMERGDFGVKSTEARISERFREKRSFDSNLVDRVRKASVFFTDMREAVENYRFNKASLQSFLMFFTRDNITYETYACNFLSRLIEMRHAGPEEFIGLISVFEDRSSLRVTDVSSVVYRDFVLCFFYYEFFDSELAPYYAREVIGAVKSRLSPRMALDDIEYLLSDCVDMDAWSGTL